MDKYVIKQSVTATVVLPIATLVRNSPPDWLRFLFATKRPTQTAAGSLLSVPDNFGIVSATTTSSIYLISVLHEVPTIAYLGSSGLRRHGEIKISGSLSPKLTFPVVLQCIGRSAHSRKKSFNVIFTSHPASGACGGGGERGVEREGRRGRNMRLF